MRNSQQDPKIRKLLGPKKPYKPQTEKSALEKSVMEPMNVTKVNFRSQEDNYDVMFTGFDMSEHGVRAWNG